MPPMEVADLNEKAVLWTIGMPDIHNEPTVDPPVEIKCKWTQGRSDTLSPQGEVLALDAQAVIDRSIPVGSRMWLGKMSDWYVTGSAGHDDEVMEVITYKESSDNKNRSRRRIIGLKYFRDSPH